MPISIKANPQSSVIVAPKRVVSDDSVIVSFALVNWTTDTAAEITTDTGANIEFRTSVTTGYPIRVDANPYSNMIVAPEKL